MPIATLSKFVGKRFALAILISIIFHFLLLIFLGLWTMYQFVAEDESTMTVFMEQGDETEIIEPVDEVVLEIADVQEVTPIELDRLMVDPIHEIPPPQITTPAVAIPSPVTPTIPTSLADRVAFSPPTQRRAGSAFGSTEFFGSSGESVGKIF